MLFAIWTGSNEHASPRVPRTSEIVLMVPGAPAAIDTLYQSWAAKGAHVVEEPHDDAFGRTFVVADRSGNLIRVSPVH